MMIDKRLISMIPESRRLIIMKTLVSWVSLLAGICLWFCVAGLLQRALFDDVTGVLSGVSDALGHGTSSVANGSEASAADGLKMWAAALTGAGGFLASVKNSVLVAAAVVCIAVRFVLTRVSSALTHRISSGVKMRLRDAIYAKLRALSGDYSGAFPTSEIVQLAGDGVEQLESYFCNYLPQFFYALLAPLTLLVVFLPLSPLTAVVLFLCVPLIPAAIMAVQKVAKRLLRGYWDAYASLGDSFLENLQGLTTLKVYSADEQRHVVMNQESEHFRVITMKVLTMQLNSITIMDLVAYGGTALGSILCGRAFLLGQVSFGGAVAMILLASEFFLAMRSLGSYFHVAMNGIAASERMFRLFDLPEKEDGGRPFSDGDITVSDLSFSYAEGKQALSDIDFVIKKGSFVSAAGESGCGKSTLASLISGIRGGYTGEIRIDGTELSDISEESLRRGVTVVSSGSYLFAGSVRKTLLEGKPEAGEDELKDALRRVNLLDFVESQGGLDMRLAERGSNLSGGQRQRLALARALLKDSPIYIFDEATSNIDAESEESIMQVIRSLKGKHTIILISHRLANVTDSDEIFFLKNGRLAESGTHAALMAAGKNEKTSGGAEENAASSQPRADKSSASSRLRANAPFRQGGGYAALYNAQQELENIGKEVSSCAETA